MKVDDVAQIGHAQGVVADGVAKIGHAQIGYNPFLVDLGQKDVTDPEVAQKILDVSYALQGRKRPKTQEEKDEELEALEVKCFVCPGITYRKPRFEFQCCPEFHDQYGCSNCLNKHYQDRPECKKNADKRRSFASERETKALFEEQRQTRHAARRMLDEQAKASEPVDEYIFIFRNFKFN